MTNFPIVLIEEPTEDHHAVIFNGINEYAASRNLTGTGAYFFVVYDENKNIIAAISGFDNFGYAEIGGLWVHEKYRTHGYGKALVDKAEEWAKQKSCAGLTLFTLKDWPACSWYQHLGFEIEFDRINHRNHSIGSYLIKQFD